MTDSKKRKVPEGLRIFLLLVIVFSVLISSFILWVHYEIDGDPTLIIIGLVIGSGLSFMVITQKRWEIIA